MSKLSQYELEREANIARNRLLLEQLELKQAVEGIAPAKPKAKSAAKPIQPAKKEKRKREPEEVQPRRQSARLRKSVIDPNETPAKRRKREKEEEEQRLREEQERLEREEAARQAQRPRHNKLDLISLVEHGPEEIASLSKSMEAIPQASTQRVADFNAFAYEDSKEDKRALEELKEKMSNLVVHARAKVTKSRVYCAAYHPEVTKDLIFFGDKEGAIGIWDARAPPDDNEDDDEDAATNEDKEGGKYWRIQLHWPANAKSSVSSIKIDPIDSHNIYTTSYDTTVRSLSFTTGESREIFSSDNLVCCLDVSPSGHDIWLSDSLGWATHLDPREPQSKARSYGLSDNKIGTISINPTRPNFICTASNSRFVKVWDVRKLGEIVAELGDHSSATTIDFNAETLAEYLDSKKGRSSLRGEYQHNKSATAAFWDPRGRQILSTSYDDKLRLWNLDAASLKSSDRFESFQPFSQISHNCQTGKWVTLLKAQWSRNPDVYPHFTIGNMNHSLEVYSCKGDLVTRLADPRRITAVQAVTCSHPSIIERVVSGNATGRCVLWAPEDLQ